MTATDLPRLLGLFLLLLAIYLAIAGLVYAPWGYYGTVEEPRFGDPWRERADAILSGRLLYRDVFTSTPPLTNYLLLAPSLVARAFGDRNPGATLAFMLYFALFNLLTAIILWRGAATPGEGWRAAAVFLLNPLTFGNAILRRQDEAILTCFFALSLALLARRGWRSSALAMGATLLVKLTGALLIPVALLHRRDWRLLVAPLGIFALAMLPFVILAGRAAFFWDPQTDNAEHPFQFDGISLGNLWNKFHPPEQDLSVALMSVLFLLAVGGVAAFILWRPRGLYEDLLLVLIPILIFSPKLHAGYFSLLVVVAAPLLARYRLHLRMSISLCSATVCRRAVAGALSAASPLLRAGGAGIGGRFRQIPAQELSSGTGCDSAGQPDPPGHRRSYPDRRPDGQREIHPMLKAARGRASWAWGAAMGGLAGLFAVWRLRHTAGYSWGFTMRLGVKRASADAEDSVVFGDGADSEAAP